MQRVLDLDLDFFVREVAYYRDCNDDRLDSEEYPPWTVAEALAFLRDRCGLDRKVPGFVVEHHKELFPLWREAIEAGKLAAPFHLTHVDAHADLGQGDMNHRYLLTELLFAVPKDRNYPNGGPDRLNDGSWLAFAVACQWIAEIVYVRNPDSECDIHPWLMEGFDAHADYIRLTALSNDQFARLNSIRTARGDRPDFESQEPRVRLQQVGCQDFRADQPFDIVCLARSPSFTPAAADPIFDEIRRRFIDDSVFLTGQ